MAGQRGGPCDEHDVRGARCTRSGDPHSRHWVGDGATWVKSPPIDRSKTNQEKEDDDADR